MSYLPGKLFSGEQGPINQEARDASAQECGDLGREVKRVGIIEARAAMDIRSYGQQLVVDVVEDELLLAQFAAGAIMNARVCHLKDAVLARHDARFTVNRDAELDRRTRGK